ncbi:MAG: hypothetical protein ACXWPK_13285, partial [Isosphaeraceae bacterium]
VDLPDVQVAPTLQIVDEVDQRRRALDRRPGLPAEQQLRAAAQDEPAAQRPWRERLHLLDGEARGEVEEVEVADEQPAAVLQGGRREDQRRDQPRPFGRAELLQRELAELLPLALQLPAPVVGGGPRAPAAGRTSARSRPARSTV